MYGTSIPGFSGLVGMRLRARREYLGLTIKECAERLDTESSQISRLERGQGQITLDWLFRYCLLLGVHPSQILAAAEYPRTAA